MSILFLLILFASPLYTAETIHLQLTPNQSSFKLTDLIQVEGTLTLPEGYTINQKKVEGAIAFSGPLENPPLKLDELTLKATPPAIQLHLVLEPLSTGSIEFTFLPFEADHDASLTPLWIVTEPLTLSIEKKAVTLVQPSLIAAPSQLLLYVDEQTKNSLADRQHQTSVPEALKAHSPPWKTVGLILVLFLLVLLYRWIRSLDFKRPEVELTAREKALEALQSLEKQQLPQQKAYDAFYVALSSIVRRYTEEAFQLRGPKQTTEEFFQEAKDSPFFDEMRLHYLHRFLTYADLVKFAKEEPSERECTQALTSAIELVQS